MTLKTILIPTERGESMSSALQTALLLARRFDSYIEGFALQPGISQFLAVDMGGSRRRNHSGRKASRRR